MYCKLIYHVQNAVEPELSADVEASPFNWVNHHMAINLTSGGLRKYAKDINFTFVRDDYHGFEVIVSYPDFLIPGKSVLYNIILDQEGIVDIHFNDKPVCFDRIHLHQISKHEFMMRFCESKALLLNAHTVIQDTYGMHYTEVEKKAKAILDKLNQQNESQDTEKESHVL